QAEHAEPGRRGVEGPRVTDLRGLGCPSDHRDDVVRRDARGLVDEQQPFDGPQAHDVTGSPRSTRARRSIVPAGPCSLVYPAARRWPPPPKAAAATARSCPPRERTLTLNRPSRCCLRIAATSAPRAVPSTSIRSSVSPGPDPASASAPWGRHAQD